ncbi:MAG: alpha/beta fold hydrolase [Bacteroidota bacterium]
MERRNFITGTALAGIGGILPFKKLNAQTMNTTNTQDAALAFDFFKKESDEFKFINVLGKVHYKLADIGELLAIKNAVNEDDAASYVSVYTNFADKCKTTANDCLKKGHRISARDAYLRASSYYYAAMDYLDEALQSDKFTAMFKVHRDCWRAGIKLMDVDYEEFDIPYQDKTIKGFFIGHKQDKSRKPLCIYNNGSDGSILDCWAMGGAAMFEREYNLVTFDGPGQGSSLFEKNIFFRHDWEKVITPVVDSVINRKEVDKNKIVLLGLSQGGYWVPRAAAFEKRLKAIVVDPGVVNVSTSWFGSLPKEMVTLYKSGNKDLFNKYLEGGMQQSPVAASLYNFRARPYGFDNPYDTYAAVEKYNLTGIADKITCPVIITSPDDESFWPGQSQQLYDMIKAPKELISFTRTEGGNYHCEPKARVLWEQKVLDKLDEVIKS